MTRLKEGVQRRQRHLVLDADRASEVVATLFRTMLRLALGAIGLAFVTVATRPFGTWWYELLPGVVFVVGALVALRRSDRIAVAIWRHQILMAPVWVATAAVMAVTGGARSPYALTCLVPVALSASVGQTVPACCCAAADLLVALAVGAVTGDLHRPAQRELLAVNELIYVALAAGLVLLIVLCRWFLLRPADVLDAVEMSYEERERLLLDNPLTRILRRFGLLTPDQRVLLAYLAQGARQAELVRPRDPQLSDPGSVYWSRATVKRRLKEARETIGASNLPGLVALFVAWLRRGS